MLIIIIGSSCVKEVEELDASLLKNESFDTANFFEPQAENLKDISSKKICTKVELALISSLRSLKLFLASGKKEESIAFRLASLGQDACRGDKASQTASLVHTFMNQSISKVGLILSSKEGDDDFLHGFEVGLNKEVLLRKAVVVKFRVLTKEATLKALAELVFIDNINFVIGGMSLEVAKALAAKVPSLRLPLILLNKEPHLLPKKSAIFRVYPNDFDLASKLALLTQKRGYKKIAILRPDSGKSDIFIGAYKKAISELNQKNDYTQTYTPGDFESMDQSVQKIVSSLGVKPAPLAHESPEKDNLMANEQKPQLKDAAVLIADNFKVVRYFAKLFKFYNAQGISFLGNQEWRSKDLVEPWDSFLSSSFFVDYIGRYSDLPSGFKLGQKLDSYLVTNESAASVDTQLIGWRVATIVRSILKKKSLRKDNITDYMMALFSKGTEKDKVPIFYPDKTLKWKVYGFGLHSKEILML